MKHFCSILNVVALLLWATTLPTRALTEEEYLNTDYRIRLGFALPTAVENKILELVKGDRIIEVVSLAYAPRSKSDVIAATVSLRVSYELGHHVMHISCVVIKDVSEKSWESAAAFPVKEEPARIIKMSTEQIMDARLK